MLIAIRRDYGHHTTPCNNTENAAPARGWSLSKLAEETGVSKAMLGQIERNESSPTVSTLWKIATGLNVPFSAFITPEADRQAVFDPQQQAMVVKPLFPWDETLGLIISPSPWHPAR
jgi:transcriptional regulator with XRE-family HTH domain